MIASLVDRNQTHQYIASRMIKENLVRLSHKKSISVFLYLLSLLFFLICRNVEVENASVNHEIKNEYGESAFGKNIPNASTQIQVKSDRRDQQINNVSLIVKSFDSEKHDNSKTEDITNLTKSRKSPSSATSNVVPKETLFDQKPPLKKNLPLPTEICVLSQNPLPVVFMSYGRSGTASTWQIMSELVGKGQRANEYTGSSLEKSRAFFEDKIPAGNGGKWLLSLLCREQRYYPKSAIVGFRWKPFTSSIDLPASIEGLQRAAEAGVRFVWSERNVLDVVISRHKHTLQSDIKGHCSAGDEACLKEHAPNRKLTLPTGNLIQKINYLRDGNAHARGLLKQLNISHVSVSYDKLYYSPGAEEWMRIFQFLGVGPRFGLTMGRVTKIMGYAPTSVRSHNDSLANFEEVSEVLKESGFEDLLH